MSIKNSPRDLREAIESDIIECQEASIMLGIHHATVIRKANSGIIPHVRIGKKIVFVRSEIEKLKNSRI